MTDTPTGGVTVTGATVTATITTCGTCRYWGKPADDRRALCDWARHGLPFSMRHTVTAVRTWEDEGADCVMWKAAVAVALGLAEKGDTDA